ncbi:hypothetical protein PHYPSEUDO_011163 [Phytophthora pseudosyringae]|uniref:M96 mating-specific protein family n=1 Tax=Phytophthora pseudosyringae TaxID=221518 RepID=A0A8T1V9E1_9STRA|nr:hypothetical protein PHYPSEUDO_011163 [Phytophthora pseudosyringae]
MSFLNADDTLADALAFLDSFDDEQLTLQPKKKRVRSARSTSTALQRRQKTETLQLREQVAGLELHLQRLTNLFQSRYDGHIVMTEGGGYDMKMKRKTRYDQAMTKYQERLQAEKDNYKLRELLEVGYDMTLLTLNFVQEKVPRPLNGASHCGVQLEKKVENLYCRSSMLFPDGPASISSHTVITNDERRGKVIEMMTVTPMACSVKDAGDLVWRCAGAQVALIHHFLFFMVQDQGTHPNSLEKNYVTTAASTVGLLKFEKWNYARRFEEPGRTVVAWANLIFLPEHELTLHLQSSTVITCSVDGSVDASVARSLVQLHSEPVDSCSIDHGKRNVHDTVLAFAGDVFRQHLQSQQNQLLQNAGSMERTLSIMA